MKPLLLLLALLLLGGNAYATKVAEKTLPELVSEADHVVIGTVKAVTMHTWFEFEIKDPKARTGPGKRNELKWTVILDPAEVLYSTQKTLPKELTIRLWKMWHMDLEGAKHHEGKTYILLLKGDDLQWVYPAGFYQDLATRPEIEALLKTKPRPPGPPATLSK